MRMNIISKRIYEVEENKSKFWVLILFDISGYHYVGLKVRPDESKNSVFLESINKYIDLFGIREYTYSMIKRCIYEKGIPLEISDQELFLLYEKAKESMLSYLNHKVIANDDGVTYLKWCKDQLILNNGPEKAYLTLKQNAIYWMNMGYGVGSEIRKIRPVILWRTTSDKKMCTVVPLTSKNYGDSYYFHCDLSIMKDSTAKIENMQNVSTKRILNPYYSSNKLLFISQDDHDKIAKAIERYYLFK